MYIHPKEIQLLQQSLLKWYDKNKREMPWRESEDPYCIWISEIMLQQTQVQTVIDYYKRFCSKFPTVKALAAANIHDVMKAWEGLGYYSRARNLHKAAQVIVQKYKGIVPNNLDNLLKLPGIGRYTAGAILSIAYHQHAPILDGNVMRVLTRLFHITDDVTRSSTQKILWELAESILPQHHINQFNQSMMELGALQCKPKNPLCVDCPVRDQCSAYMLNIQESLPVKPSRKPVPHYDVTAGIIWKKNRLLITLRPPKGLLGGLWEFPGGKLESGETLEECLKREILEELEIDVNVRSPLISVKHAYTHFKITLHSFHCDYISGQIVPHDCDDYKWITIDEIEQYAFPGADRKVIEKLKKCLINGLSPIKLY